MKNLYEILMRIEPIFVILTLITMVAVSLFYLGCFCKEISAKNAVKYLKKTDYILLIGVVVLTVFFTINTLLELILGYEMISMLFLILSLLLTLKCKAELNDTKQKEEQYIALTEQNQKKEKWFKYWRGDRK